MKQIKTEKTSPGLKALLFLVCCLGLGFLLFDQTAETSPLVRNDQGVLLSEVKCSPPLIDRNIPKKFEVALFALG